VLLNAQSDHKINPIVIIAGKNPRFSRFKHDAEYTRVMAKLKHTKSTSDKLAIKSI